MTEPIYVQCTLSRTIELEAGGGISRLTKVSWLPARYGVVGKVVRLQDDDELWAVTETGSRATGKDLREREKAAKKQRKASDI